MAAMWVRMQELKTNQSLHSTETLNNKLSLCGDKSTKKC